MSRSPSRDRSASRAGRTLTAASGGGGGGGGAVDPATLAGVRSWLRAKDNGAGGSTVSTWTDASSAGNNGTAIGAPTVATASTPNSGKSIRYPGTALHNIAFPWNSFGAVTVSSTYDSIQTYTCANLLDGSTSTHWASNIASGLPQWIRLELPSAAAVTEYTITPSGANYPTAWTFAGSNDASSWTTLDTRSSITLSGTTPQSYSFANSTSYLYYRLNMTASTTTIVMLAEIALTGQTLSGAQAMEVWAVVKADSGSAGGLWTFRTDSSQLYQGTSIVETFGLAGTRTYTPTVALNAWRLYRVYNDGTTWRALIDNVSQDTASGQAVTWSTGNRVGANWATTWNGNIAEVLLRNRVSTAGEVTGLIAYFNTEHGLTVT